MSELWRTNLINRKHNLTVDQKCSNEEERNRKDRNHTSSHAWHSATTTYDLDDLTWYGWNLGNGLIFW